ncbi:MAG: AAA family ATPase [Deltaproteobacteria bacterium]|nr:AAA family ATPase [Deltaproteobacteria bacterium]
MVKPTSPPLPPAPPKVPISIKGGRRPMLPPTKATRVKKTFVAEDWTGAGQGEKIILYADSGMGKTTLASMLPSPRFIGLDDGGRKIKHPVTNENLKYISGIETFMDVRDALTQPGLFDNDETIVIDTATILQDLAEKWVLENIKTDGKGSHFVDRLTDFGWGAGYRHVYDAMHLILPDLDPLVRQGKNIVLICQLQQTSISNPGGEDFLKDVPKLQNQYGKVCPAIWGLYSEWADHAFKIEYEGVKAKDDKAASSGNRVVRIHPEIHFLAKSRTIPISVPTIYFSQPDDDSVWQYLFHPEKQDGV